MPDNSCRLCALFASPQGAQLARTLRCWCVHVRHTPRVPHDHRRPGCVGYTLPAIDIVGTVDTWEEDAHAV